MANFHAFYDNLLASYNYDQLGSLLTHCERNAPSFNDSTICYRYDGSTYKDINGIVPPNVSVLTGVVASGDITHGVLLANVVLNNNRRAYTDKNEYIVDVSSLDWGNVNISPKFNALTNVYGNVIQVRDDLDQKVNDLYDQNQDIQKSLDHSIYTTLVWTILATCLLYYLFIHL